MNNRFRALRNFSFSELSAELKWIVRYIKKYKGRVAGYVLLGFLSSALALAGSVLSKKLINAVTGRDPSSITMLVVLYVIFGVGNVFLSAVMSRISVFSNTMVTQSIREDVYYSVLSSKWQAVSSLRSGDILNRINNDTTTVAGAVLTWIPTFITKLFQFVCAFVLIFHYDRAMALIALAGSPVTVIVSSFFLGKMRKNSKETRNASSSLVSFLSESLSELKNIKAFDFVSDFKARFDCTQKVLSESLLRQNRFSVFSGTVVSLLGLLVSYSCFGWSVYRLWLGKIDFGTMAMFLQLAAYVSSAFSGLVSLVPGAVSSTVSARRLMELSSIEKEQTENAELERKFIENAHEGGLTVHVESGSYSYENEKPVLRSFSFSASPGQLVALKGPSGSGKTTVFRLLLALVEGEGGFFLENSEGERIPVSAKTRSAFSFVPQGHSLFAGTVRENLLLVKPDADDEELREALRIACALDFVLKMPNGLDSVIGEDTGGLSEGQAQRIAVARAVLKGSPVLLLDEATAALDMETEKQLALNLLSLKKKRTIIVTTHRETLLSLCDKLYEV